MHLPLSLGSAALCAQHSLMKVVIPLQGILHLPHGELQSRLSLGIPGHAVHGFNGQGPKGGSPAQMAVL